MSDATAIAYIAVTTRIHLPNVRSHVSRLFDDSEYTLVADGTGTSQVTTAYQARVTRTGILR